MASYVISLGLDCSAVIEKGLPNLEHNARPLQFGLVADQPGDSEAVATPYGFDNRDTVIFRIFDITPQESASRLQSIDSLTVDLLAPTTGRLSDDNPFTPATNPFIIHGSELAGPVSRESTYFMGAYPAYDSDPYVLVNDSMEPISVLFQAVLTVMLTDTTGVVPNVKFGVDPEMVVGPSGGRRYKR
ncbi:MAG: hypothetical protein AAGD38_16455 [Acidobacteriota bacterium]